MHTYLRRRGQTWSWLVLLALGLGSLGTGCQSARPSYSFQPLSTTTIPPRPTATDAPVATPAVAAQSSTPAVAAAPARENVGRLVRTRARHLLALSSFLQPAPVRDALVQLRPHRRAVGALARTQHTTEAGLGRTVLFIVGVVLAVLAGLVALVNVIFGVGFFTALGYTAAGLVVLYLLYKLFSPKKKA